MYAPYSKIFVFILVVLILSYAVLQYRFGITSRQSKIPSTGIYTTRSNFYTTKSGSQSKSMLHSDVSRLYPNLKYPNRDRIIDQLNYIPSADFSKNTTKLKKILYLIWHYYGATEGRATFVNNQCPVDRCMVTFDPSEVTRADLIFMDNNYLNEHVRTELNSPMRRRDQIWALLNIEPPSYMLNAYGKDPPINWTISYSPLATVPLPYGNFYPVSPGVKVLPLREHKANKRTGKCVMVSSNCATSSHRDEYVAELAQYIQVDKFGGCGKALEGCSRNTRSSGYCRKQLSDLLRKYKFYLSFENSNCQTYVTEKYFERAFENDMLPIVMGAPLNHYAKISPPNSFIHVENFTSAKDLAGFLHKLDQNDDLYNEYFRWKGAWKNIRDASIHCRLCAMLHAPVKHSVASLRNLTLTEKCRPPVEP